MGLVAGIAVAYIGALIAALLAGSSEVKVAVIAVGGTAVGAVAGTVGSISGARAQAESTLRTKTVELKAAQEGILQRQRYEWSTLVSVSLLLVAADS